MWQHSEWDARIIDEQAQCSWAVAVHGDILRYSTCCATAATISSPATSSFTWRLFGWLLWPHSFHLLTFYLLLPPLLPRPIISLPSATPSSSRPSHRHSVTFHPWHQNSPVVPNIKDILLYIIYYHIHDASPSPARCCEITTYVSDG